MPSVIATAALDLEKYFDRTCWEVTFQMLNRMGSGSANLEADAELHCTLQEIQQGCGDAGTHVDLHEQHDTGMLLSLLATASLSTIWARVLEEEVPTVLCNSRVDDRRLCLRGKEAPEQMQSAIQVTRDFDRATGTRFNPLKSTCATPTRQTEKEVQQTAETVWDEDRKLRETSWNPVTYKGNRD